MKNKLIIFDFDGVLVDTEYTTFKYYKDLLPSFNIYLQEEDFKYKIGKKSIDFFRDTLKENFNQDLVDKLVEMKREAFLKEIKKYVIPMTGINNLLKQCEKEGLLMAIGSQNEKPLIEKTIDEFNIRKYFKIVTSLQDIHKKKPDPEVFLLISDTLKISPSEAVVIEDSPVGIEAAKKGGFKSIGITSSFTKKELKKADIVVSTIEEIIPSLLLNL